MAVEIQTSISIKVGDQKAIAIPPTFLVEHENRQFLKFKATGQPIVQLVCGSQAPKNGSLANSTCLDQLLKKRNQQWLNASLGQDVFQEVDKKVHPRKRRQMANQELITIDVNGQEVECLMQGQRPTKSDLTIALVPLQVQAVLNHVAQDAADAMTTRRAYKKTTGEPHEKEGEGQDQECQDGGYLSLSCSHTTAFLRALQHGCQGPAEDQKVEAPKSDPCWDLIQNGWEWLVLSPLVEQEWPILPGIFQSALNSSNAIAKAANELEVAATLAQFFQGGMTLAQALARARDGAMACQESLEHIGHFVQHFAGNYFNRQLMIGSDLMSALATTNFKVQGCVFPHLRVAIWATLSSSSKHQDGFSKLLNKSDVEKLRSNTMSDKIKSTEKILADSWKVIQDPALDVDHVTKAYGRLCVRCILFLLSKQKFSREEHEYQNLPEIVQAFSDEMKARPSMTLANSLDEEELQVTDTSQATAKNIALLQNQHVKLNQMHLGALEAPTTVQVSFDKLHLWRPTKQKMPKVCPEAQVAQGLYQGNELAQQELAKVQVDMALHLAMQSNQIAMDQCAFVLNPPGLYILKTIKKAKHLKFVAIGNVSKVKKKEQPAQDQKVQSQHIVQHRGEEWSITPWKQDHTFDQDGKSHLNPYWWVKPCDDEDVANMEFATVSQDGINVPILQNSKPLAAKEQLFYYKSKKDQEAASGSAAPSTKKRKTNK
eukprot:s4034_g9.t1